MFRPYRKGMYGAVMATLERVLLGEFGNGMVEPPVYRRRQQRLWMRREEKQPSSPVFRATA